MLISAIIVFRLSKVPVEKGIHFRTGQSAVILFSLFVLAFLCLCYDCFSKYHLFHFHCNMSIVRAQLSIKHLSKINRLVASIKLHYRNRNSLRSKLN